MKLLSNITDTLHRDLYNFSSERLKAEGLTTGLMYFILHVAKHPGCTPMDLCAALSLDRAYVLRCLKKLVEDDFIIRKPHPTDGRASILTLTEKGERVFHECRKMLFDWDESRLRSLDEDEKETLFRLLSKIETDEGRKEL